MPYGPQASAKFAGRCSLGSSAHRAIYLSICLCFNAYTTVGFATTWRGAGNATPHDSGQAMCDSSRQFPQAFPAQVG